MDSRKTFETQGDRYCVDRALLEDLLKRRFFYAPAFAAYGGVAGLYDFGPAGCAVKSNIIALWRHHFVIHDSMSEVDCSVLTPKPVLDASGHTAKFSDYMVRDVKTRQCYRADHVLKGALETQLAAEGLSEEQKHKLQLALARVDDLDQAGLAAALKEFNVKAPDTGNDITEPLPFNLMFQTSIGPTGDMPGFLRPETAQGIFVNFKRLLEFNGSKLPFAAAQVGSAFRNEIAPRAGLLRVREFTLAEIEYFVNPSEKTHRGFSSVKDTVLSLLPADMQEQGATEPIKITSGEAAAKHIIRNEALAYFMSRTYMFLRMMGIPDEHLRFRQHMRSEMAHYAADCWDAEIRTSYGWIECVGHADRTCYDLTQHTKCSAQNMTVHEAFKDGSHVVRKLIAKVNKGAVGKKFRKEANVVMSFLDTLGDEDKCKTVSEAMEKDGKYVYEAEGKQYEITPDMVSFKTEDVKVTGESFIPHVIEPSFGIGRIMYCLLEHAYWYRGEEKERGVLSLAPVIAPIKVSLFPLQSDEKFTPIVAEIADLLRHSGISNKVDETGTAIGKRYARTDELGIPFAITVDYDTLNDRTVTLRERDSMAQVRLPITDLVQVIKALCEHKMSWKDVSAKYPAHVAAEKDA